MTAPSEIDAASETIDSDAPISVLGYGLMARLAQVECTGYELSQVLGPPRNFLWEAKHSQIYPVLAELRRAGCVTYSHVVQENRPDKKIYRLTERGMERLKAWARKGPTRTPIRNEFYLKLNAIWLLPPADAIEMLELQMEMLGEEIDMMDSHLRDLAERTGEHSTFRMTDNYSGIHAAVTLIRQTTELTLATCQRLVEKIRSDMAMGDEG